MWVSSDGESAKDFRPKTWSGMRGQTFHTDSPWEEFSRSEAVCQFNRITHANIMMCRIRMEREQRGLSQLLVDLLEENACRHLEGENNNQQH